MIRKLLTKKRNCLYIGLFVMNVLALIFIGRPFAVVFSWMIMVVVFVYAIIKRLSQKYENRYLNALVKVYRLGLIGICILFVLIEAFIIHSITYTLEDRDYDYVVVLGAGLYGDKISMILGERLDKTLEIYDQLEDPMVIVTGGQGPGETVTEASAMAAYLVDHGIPRDRMIEEDKATSTKENMAFSYEIMNQMASGPQKVLVVTSEFHLHRALFLAEGVGMDADGIASWTHKGFKYHYLLREFFGVVKSRLLD